MNELLSSFLSNDSRFGRLMTRFGVIIGGNLMFILFSLPFITIGAAYTALHFVMLKTLRGDGVVNPFKLFWHAFRENFRQATAAWLAALLLSGFLFADFRLVSHAGGSLDWLRIPLLILSLLLAVMALYLCPVMAAFKDTLPHLLRNCLFFASRRIYKVPVILFFNLFPLYLTYTDPQMLPLYAFLWTFFGFGAVAMLNSALLLPEMRPFLPKVNAFGDFITEEEEPKTEDGMQPSQKQILEDMKKLGM